MKLHNGGTLGLGIQIAMCQASQTLHCNNVATTHSLVSCCSHFLLWKNLWRNLNYHLHVRQMKNMWTKYFYYFQGLRVLKCHRTKHSNRMNNRSKLPLQKTFSCSTPLPPGFPEPLTPPLVRISRIPSVWGCGFFLEQPKWSNFDFCVNNEVDLNCARDYTDEMEMWSLQL